jgi:hypothetical protein
LKDSNANLKMKTTEEGIMVCSFVCSILKVRRACWNSEMGIGTNEKWVNYLYGSAQTKQQVG